jgi:hypothetical protein
MIARVRQPDASGDRLHRGDQSMPLYTVTTQAGVLSGKAKAKLAAELTRRCVMKPMRPTEGWPPHRCGEPEIATV